MITNRIIKGILDDFSKQYQLQGDESKLFEFLVNYIVISGFEFSRQIDVDLLRDLDVDSEGGTFGIDSIQIFVNDNIIFSPSDLDIYIKSNTLKVDLVFVQSKTSAKFDSGDMLKTIAAVKRFLKNDRNYPDTANDNLKNAHEMYKKLFNFKYSQHLDSSSPHVHIFYVTTAENIHEDTSSLCVQQADELREAFQDLKGFTVKPLGASYIIDMYKEAVNVVSATFNFKNKLELDEITGVSSSFIGYISGIDFLNLLKDPQGGIRKWIFYDNVRDFQGLNNNVNTEICNTIRDAPSRDKFMLFNNGVTIVAKSLKSLGSNNYTIKDYQIVNGCQTSNVVFENKKHAADINVPIKLIITENENIVYSIVRANNRQTPVSDEQFSILDIFHRRLQDTYLSYSKDMPIKIFYERRSGEARQNSNISGYRVISLHSVIRCITATAFQSAYIVYNNNPVNILRNRKDRIFQKGQIHEIYYVGNYLLELLLSMHRDGVIPCNIKNKYYIIMIAFIIICNTTESVNMTSIDTRKNFQRIIERLRTEDMSDTMKNAAKFFAKILSSYPRGKDDVLRDRAFNKKIISELQKIE